MTKRFLIDATDPRFFVPGNEDVLAFVRRANPFAHSDPGSVLLELGKCVAGSHDYSPSYKDCAYVVLHTDAWRIVAIAFGQRMLAFRLAAASHAAALADGGTPAPEIGPDWVSFAAFDSRKGNAEHRARLERWCAQAFADVAALPAAGE